MSKTYAIYRRMSPLLARSAKNLIDAMLMSNDDIGWDNDQQLIVDGRVYYGTDIVKLIGYVMSPADNDFKEPNGLKIFIQALKKIGLESEYVENRNVKMALEKVNDIDEVSEEESDSDTSFVTDDDSDDSKRSSQERAKSKANLNWKRYDETDEETDIDNSDDTNDDTSKNEDSEDEDINEDYDDDCMNSTTADEDDEITNMDKGEQNKSHIEWKTYDNSNSEEEKESE